MGEINVSSLECNCGFVNCGDVLYLSLGEVAGSEGGTIEPLQNQRQN